MVSSSILHGIFGVPVADIGVAEIQQAIEDRVVENDELDWKRKPYRRGQGAEIAKDLAALANHRGGVIVIGVDEDGHAAHEQTPTDDSAAEIEKMIRSAAAARIQPFLSGITVRQTEDLPGTTEHFVIISVEPSRDAPHACTPDGPNGNTLSYPVRHGADTRYLKEFEVATRYRDRQASRTALTATLERIHNDGLANSQGLDTEASLSVAVVPVNRGSRPHGPDARAAETQFLTEWNNRTSIPNHDIEFVPLHKNFRVRPGRQRTIFTTPEITAELEHQGAGYLSPRLRFLPQHPVIDDATGENASALTNTVMIPTDRIEWTLFTAITFLIDHAIDTGASGEIEIRAQLHFTRGTGNRNGGICIPLPRPRAGQLTHELPPGARLSPTTTAVHTTTGIADATTDRYRNAAAAAYFLASDIFAEFGVDEPHIFTDLGTSNSPLTLSDAGLSGVRDWLQEHLAPPPS